MSFFGKTLFPRTIYKERLENSLHLTRASMHCDYENKDCRSQVRVCVQPTAPEKSPEWFRICHLTSLSPDCNLDLVFDKGDLISFQNMEDGNVDLLGYYVIIDDENDENFMDTELPGENIGDDDDDNEDNELKKKRRHSELMRLLKENDDDDDEDEDEEWTPCDDEEDEDFEENDQDFEKEDKEKEEDIEPSKKKKRKIRFGS